MVLITTLVQKLTSFEAKLETILSRLCIILKGLEALKHHDASDGLLQIPSTSANSLTDTHT